MTVTAPMLRETTTAPMLRETHTARRCLYLADMHARALQPFEARAYFVKALERGATDAEVVEILSAETFEILACLEIQEAIAQAAGDDSR